MKFRLLVLLILIVTTSNITLAQNKPVINHIAVYVSDLKISTHFYRDIVGLDTIPEPFHDGKHTWFTIGSYAALHIIQGASSIVMHDKNSHLCLSVPSLESFLIQLDKNNISYENWAGQSKSVTLRVDGVKQIYFKDPDGFWLEVNDSK